MFNIVFPKIVLGKAHIVFQFTLVNQVAVGVNLMPAAIGENLYSKEALTPIGDNHGRDISIS